MESASRLLERWTGAIRSDHCFGLKGIRARCADTNEGYCREGGGIPNNYAVRSGIGAVLILRVKPINMRYALKTSPWFRPCRYLQFFDWTY